MRRYGNDHSSGHGLPLTSSTPKIPPGWSLEQSDRYSLSAWLRDLRLWLVTTELDDYQKGPAMALRLHGLARNVADDLADLDSDVSTHALSSQLPHGTYEWDSAGHATVVHGWQLLGHALKEKFGELSTEKLLTYLIEFFSFRPQPNEAPDAILARYEMVK